MPPLNLIYGPDIIFSQKAEVVTHFDDGLRALCQNMLDTLYEEKAVGLGANMVGILQRIIVIDLQKNGTRDPKIMINPVIIEKSDDTQCHEEASVCFPAIGAKVTRPRKITLTYQDCHGAQHELTAEDYFATVIQHEIDYLNGVIFLDYLSPLKRKMLLKKTQKIQKQKFQNNPT